jgi:S-(hydroxymethyl)glutathione dehydrogenase/alcohol dehydrogenase
MKAAVCYEFGKPLIVEEVELDPPKKNEVRVRLAATAICHSDIHVIRGDLKERFGKLPYVAGHESAGYVEEVGENVSTFKPGDAVVVAVLRNCGECNFCKSGFPHLCMIMREQETVSPLRNKKGQRLTRHEKLAGFSEKVLVDKTQLARIPPDMPMDRAALLACAVITGFGAVVFRAQVKPFKSVVVVGAGGVGLNAIQGAAFVGAYPVIAVDVADMKLKAAKIFGATHTVNAASKDAIDAVKRLTNGDGADHVFVTVGNTNAIRQGFMMSGTRGTTYIVGLPPLDNSNFTFSAFDFISREKNLGGVFLGSTNLSIDIPHLASLYKTGSLKLDELITNRYPLANINDAIESVEKGEALRNVIMF